MRGWKRVLALAVGVASLSSISSGYYYWTYFSQRSAPFTAVPKRFDYLNALTNKTVSYFISDQQPGPLVPGDSFPALVSQIRLAASAWDGVATSDLRVKFGGVANVSAPQSTPGIDIVFDDNMPPGLLAQTRTITADDVSGYVNAQGFVPIVRSRVQLHKDLNASKQASYSDVFFTTLVHEIGHALGLQHTLTASAMTTLDAGRATTKARPLTPDDVAGVSGLYPAAGFAAATGSIAGRVTLSGAGVNLASVVALSTSGATNGTAISAMTNPDGTYRIDGIPPGQYYVYAHPLPPAQQGEASPANIVAPQDPTGYSFPANTGFDTQFFPGTKDWTQAVQVGVNASASVDNVNFNVSRRTGPAVYNLQLYAYQGAGGQVPVPSPALTGGVRTSVAFYAPGIAVNGNPAPGLGVGIVGGPSFVEAGSVRSWQSGYLQAVVNAQVALNDKGQPVATPMALALTVNNDLYVLPSAITVAPTGPPAINFVAGSSDAQGNATVTIAGVNLSADTRVLFDGAAATLPQVNPDGSLTVAAPPANGAYRANVEALASDGQTSAQALGNAAPPAFTYAAPDGPFITLNPAFPSSVVAGTDAVIQIDGSNVNFMDGQTVVGFGSSDVQVRRTWVVNSTRLLVNLVVAPTAAPGVVAITVSNGLELVRLSTTLQIQPYNARQMTLRAPVLNQANVQAGLPAGGVPVGGLALIGTQNVPANLAGWTLTMGDTPVAILLSGGNQIVARVPASLSPGKPAIVRLISPTGEYIAPIAMQVDGPAPVIQPMSAGQSSVRAGDSVTLMVTGLAEPSGALAASQVRVSVGGVMHTPTSVMAVAGAHQVTCTLSPQVPGGPQSVSVGVDTRFSAQVMIVVRN